MESDEDRGTPTDEAKLVMIVEMTCTASSCASDGSVNGNV